MLVQYQERKVCVFWSLMPKKIIENVQSSHFWLFFMIFSYFLGLEYFNHLKIFIKTFGSCFHVCHSNVRRKNSSELVKITKKQPKMACRGAVWAFFASPSIFDRFLCHVIIVVYGTGDDTWQKHPKIAERGKKMPKQQFNEPVSAVFGLF